MVTPWGFINEFIKREANWLKKGGKFIVPFPKLKLLVNKMKKKILILGVSGQDGSLLAEHLIKKKNILIYGLIRKSSNRNYNNLKTFIN